MLVAVVLNFLFCSEDTFLLTACGTLTAFGTKGLFWQHRL